MPKRVLVVDDYPGVSLALKAAFRMDGRFELTDSAATAAEGLELLESQDAVLLDFNLPDMEGIDVVRAFRFRRPATPLILHSASDNTPEIALDPPARRRRRAQDPDRRPPRGARASHRRMSEVAAVR